MLHWGLQLKETNKSDVNSHTRPEMKQLYCLPPHPPHLSSSVKSQIGVACVLGRFGELRASKPLWFPTHAITPGSLVMFAGHQWSPRKKKTKKKTRKERICGGKCGSATFNLVLKFQKKKKKKMCGDWVTSNRRLLQHCLLWKQMTFKSAVSASSLRDPQVSQCITTPFSTLVKLLIPRC